MELVAGKMLDLVILTTLWALTLYFISSKREIWVRRLPAIDFIDESVGRAAEMGKAVVVQGFGGGLARSIAPMIIAGLSVLGHVARICARHGTQIVATMQAQDVIPVADEVLRTAYRLEGKEEEYESQKEQIIQYLPTQASRVALAFRLRPATHIMIGAFWHESVQLCEAYGRVGAVQIGGTARMSQVPFFSALCDMSLIGEEIYAVGAYIAGTNETLSSLAVQDYFKIISIAVMIIGTLLVTIGGDLIAPLEALLRW